MVLDKKNANKLFQQAHKLEDEGLWEDALKIRVDLVTSFPKSKTLTLTLANTLKEVGRLDDAEKYYQKAIELDPTSELASLHLFHFYWDDENKRWKKEQRLDQRDKAFDEIRRFQSISHCEDYVEIIRELNEKYGGDEES